VNLGSLLRCPYFIHYDPCYSKFTHLIPNILIPNHMSCWCYSVPNLAHLISRCGDIIANGKFGRSHWAVNTNASLLSSHKDAVLFLQCPKSAFHANTKFMRVLQTARIRFPRSRLDFIPAERSKKMHTLRTILHLTRPLSLVHSFAHTPFSNYMHIASTAFNDASHESLGSLQPNFPHRSRGLARNSTCAFRMRAGREGCKKVIRWGWKRWYNGVKAGVHTKQERDRENDEAWNWTRLRRSRYKSTWDYFDALSMWKLEVSWPIRCLLSLETGKQVSSEFAFAIVYLFGAVEP